MSPPSYISPDAWAPSIIRRREPADPIPFYYYGQTGELFRLWLHVTGLTIVTLGIYRFWGTTRFRQYLWNHVAVDGDRLEYDGTGGELLRRFLVTAAVLLVIFAVPAGIFMALGWSVALAIWRNFAPTLLLALIPFAIYASRRYRLSRTVWRGMRGGLEGSAFAYGVRSLGWGLATILTLGLARAWYDTFAWRYAGGRTRFGDWRMRVRCKGGWMFKSLMFSYVALILYCAIGTILWVFVIMNLAFIVLNTNNHDLNGISAVFSVFNYFITPLSAAFYFTIYVAATMFYRARWMNLRIRCMRLGKVRLQTYVLPEEIFKLDAGNFLITVLTLGFGRVFAQHRTFAFMAAKVRMYGRGSLETLSQRPGRPRSKAEGLVQFLDLAGEGFG